MDGGEREFKTSNWAIYSGKSWQYLISVIYIVHRSRTRDDIHLKSIKTCNTASGFLEKQANCVMSAILIPVWGGEGRLVMNPPLPCPGIFFILPCIENYSKVDLRTSVIDIPPQEVSYPIPSHLSGELSSSIPPQEVSCPFLSQLRR